MQNGFETQAWDSAGTDLCATLRHLAEAVERDFSKEVVSIDLHFGRIIWPQSRAYSRRGQDMLQKDQIQHLQHGNVTVLLSEGRLQILGQCFILYSNLYSS